MLNRISGTEFWVKLKRERRLIAFARHRGHNGVLPLKTVCLNLREHGEAFYCNSSRVGLLVILRWVQGLHPRILLGVSLEAEPGPGCTLVSWLLLPCLCVPSLNLDVWICLASQGRSWSWICPLQTQNRGHRKTSIPRSPHRVYLVQV